MLSPTANWTAAFASGSPEPILYCEIKIDGSTTYTALSGPSDSLTDDVAILSASPVGATMDVVSRDVKIQELTLVFMDDWLRPIIKNHRLRNKKVTVKLGERSMTSSGDFLAMFVGVIDSISPAEGTAIEVTCLDGFSILQQQYYDLFITGTHPLELIEDFLNATLPSELVDSTSLDHTSYTDTSHYVASYIDYDARSNSSRQSPKSAVDAVKSLSTLMDGTIYADETGVAKFVQFNASKTADDNWTADDYSDFEQSAIGENIINRVSVNFARSPHLKESFNKIADELELKVARMRFAGPRTEIRAKIEALRNDYARRFEDNDTDSQSDYAYPGESSAVFDLTLDNKWVNGFGRVIADIPASGSFSLQIKGMDVGAFCGANVSDIVWPGTAQTPENTLNSNRLLYVMIDNEIMTSQGSMTLDGKSYASRVGIETDPDQTGWAQAAGSAFVPFKLTINVTGRGQLGTSAAAHSTDAVAYDVTIPVAQTKRILRRFSDGMEEVSLSTSLSKAFLQVGDFVTIANSEYIAFNRDGLTTSIVWEIVEKEVDVFGGPPRCNWKLNAVKDNSYTQSTTILVRPDIAIKNPATRDPGNIIHNYIPSGIAVDNSSGLSADINAGTVVGVNNYTKIDLPYTRTFGASADSYVRMDAASGALVILQVSNGAAVPEIEDGMATVAKVVTDGTKVTSIVDQRVTRAYDAAMVNTPAFATYRNTTVTNGATSKTSVTVPFDTVDFDYDKAADDDNFDESTNNDWTAKTAGVYRFSSRVSLASMADGSNAYLELHKNGTAVRQGGEARNNTGGAITLPLEADFGSLELAAGDVIKVNVYNDDASNRDIVGGAKFTWFTGEKIR